MKKFKLFITLILIASFATSCIDDDNDELTGDAIEGGLLSINTPAIAYVVGNGATYSTTGTVYQGNVQTQSIDIYKSFTDSETGDTSNEVLFTSITLDNTSIGASPSFQTSFTYEDLINDLALNGNALPASDADLNIGDYWTLRYVSHLSTGNTVSNATRTKISLGTRFAGTYRTLEAAYWRIGVNNSTTPDWPDEIVIESVDATTYKVVEYFGLFNGNEWYFQIDENDIITYPAETPSGDAQTGNGEPLITCTSHPQELTNIPCGTITNYVERDNVNGEDKLYMSFGYLTGNTPGNSREFYQVLEKIVN